MNPIEEKHYMNNENQREWENKSDAIVHAIITKETAVGFAEWFDKWKKDNQAELWKEKYQVEKFEPMPRMYFYTTSELYEIYVESL